MDRGWHGALDIGGIELQGGPHITATSNERAYCRRQPTCKQTSETNPPQEFTSSQSTIPLCAFVEKAYCPHPLSSPKLSLNYSKQKRSSTNNHESGTHTPKYRD